MLKILIFALSVGTVLAISSLAYSRDNDAIIYEFKGDIPPIKLTFSDLDRFLRDLQHLYAAVPENVENHCTYELAGPKGSISGPSIEKVFGDDRLLTFANEFRLSCFNRRLSVNSINITLGHSPRWEIKGTDRVLLESVRSHLDNFGQTYQTYLGGLLPEVVVLIFSCLLVWVVLLKLADKVLLIPEARKYVDINVIGALFLATSLFAGIGLGRLGILQSLFPTVAIYRGTASLLERYSAEVGFWGLIFSVVLSVILWRRPVANVAPKIETPHRPPEGQDLSPKA